MKFRVEIDKNQDVLKNKAVEITIHIDKLCNENINLDGMDKDAVVDEFIKTLNMLL